jgi:hypothetical protein
MYLTGQLLGQHSPLSGIMPLLPAKARPFLEILAVFTGRMCDFTRYPVLYR